MGIIGVPHGWSRGRRARECDGAGRGGWCSVGEGGGGGGKSEVNWVGVGWSIVIWRKLVGGVFGSAMTYIYRYEINVYVGIIEAR